MLSGQSPVQSMGLRGREIQGILFHLVGRGDSGGLSVGQPLQRAVSRGQIREAKGIWQTQGMGTGLKWEKKAQMQN